MALQGWLERFIMTLWDGQKGSLVLGDGQKYISENQIDSFF